jgi:hypothetical protein
MPGIEIHGERPRSPTEMLIPTEEAAWSGLLCTHARLLRELDHALEDREALDLRLRDAALPVGRLNGERALEFQEIKHIVHPVGVSPEMAL